MNSKRNLPSQFTIIIDGHNLAYYLYNLRSGQRLSQNIAQTLADHLSDYQKTFGSANPEIELCFDGGVRPPTADPPMVRILAAGPHNKADYLVLDRFRFHSFSGHPCLVITNDGEILEKLDQEGGSYLNVFDFVLLRHSTHPVFLPPEDLPFDIPDFIGQPKKTIAPDSSGIVLAEAIRQFGRLKPARKKPLSSITTQKTLPEPTSRTTQEPPKTSADQKINPALNKQLPIQYILTLDTWPIEIGVRFLLASFCSTHRPDFINLLESFDLSQIRPADVAILAEFLRSSCSAEPGFTHRGSLMDRTRLALLKAGDEGLDLETLAAEINLKPEGLHGRIKRKANGWLTIRILHRT